MEAAVKEITPKSVLATLTRHFNFSIDLLEDRQRLQNTVYILKASGAKLGYGFSQGEHGPYSRELFFDCQEVLGNPRYDKARSSWHFSEDTLPKIKEVQQRFIDPVGTPRDLELLASFHMFYTHYQNKELLPYELKQKFRETKTKTFGDDSPITDEQLKEAHVQAANLIAYENFHK